MITLPATILTDTLANASLLFNDFKPLIFLIIGISIAFSIVDVIRNKHNIEKIEKIE